MSGVFAVCAAVRRTGVFYVISVALKPYGFENAEKTVVQVLGPLGNIVKLSRFRSKVFHI